MRSIAPLCLAISLGACTQSGSTPTTPAEEAEAKPAPVGCGPVDALNELDPRRPVPLQPMMAWHQKQNMQDHLQAIQQIAGGAAREDWAAIEAASARIEPSPQMNQMCEHMGAGADGFTELALEFHRRATQIGEAARNKDGKGVLAATAHTLAACTQCHSTYRQEVVGAATWEARTGSGHTPAMHGH